MYSCSQLLSKIDTYYYQMVKRRLSQTTEIIATSSYENRDSVLSNKSNKPSRSVKISYEERDAIPLSYDTKQNPFRYVKYGECDFKNFHNIWNAIVDMRQKVCVL